MHESDLVRCSAVVWIALGLAACSAAEKPRSEVQLQARVSGVDRSKPLVTGDFTFVEEERAGAAPFAAEGEVAAVAASPDGKLLVSGGGHGGALVLWDAATGTPLGPLALDGEKVTVPVFSPDGARVAAVVHGRGIIVWDVATRAVVLEIPRREGAQIFSLAYHPAGELLASVDGNGEVALWDATKPGGPRVLVGRGGAAGSAAFSPDGKTVAAMSDRRTLTSFDVASGKALAVLARGIEARSAAYGPDGSLLVTVETASDGASIAVVRDRVGAVVSTLRGHTFLINAVAITRDGKRVLTGASDGTIRVWDARSGDELRVLRSAAAGVWSIALAPDERRVAVAGQGNVVQIFDLASGQRLLTSADHIGPITSVAYSRDGTMLASADASGRVIVRGSKKGRPVRLPDQGGRVRQVGFSPDGRRLLTISGSELRTWDAASGEALSRSPLSRSSAFFFSPAGDAIAVSDESRVVTLLDAASLRPLRTFGAAQPNDDVRQNLMTPSSVSFSPGGDAIAIARWDQPTAIWETATGTLLRTLPEGTLFVAYAPSGGLLATGSGVVSKRSGPLSLMLVDAATGAKRHGLDADPDAVFSPDGRWVVALRDGELRAFETETGRSITKTPPHGATTLTMAPDGARVVTGSADGSVRTFRVEASPR